MSGYESYINELPEFKALKDMERRYVLEYVSDPKRNGTRAALRAGYEAGVNNASAAVASSRLLKRDKIQQAVSALEAKIGGPDCLARLESVLNAIIFTDLTDVMSWDGQGRVKMIPSEKLSPAAAAAIAQVQDIHEEQQRRLPLGDEDDVAVETIKRNVKMHDKLRAVETLARLKGFYAAEKHDVTVNGDLRTRLEEARAALEGGCAETSTNPN